MSPAAAQQDGVAEYPVRPVRLVVTFVPKEFDALVKNEIQRIEKLLAAGMLAQE